MNRLLALSFLTFPLFSCHTPGTITESKSAFYTPEKSSIDSSVFAMTSPYSKQLDETMNEVLAHSAEPLEKGQPESKLGNFVADLCFETGNSLYIPSDGIPIDFCLLNNGGLRSILPSGAVTRRHIYELMPFDNELVVVTLGADSVYKLLQYIVDKGGVPVSNIRLNIGSGSPLNVMIGNKSYDKNKNYKIITSDYLANGGDAMSMFSGAIKTEVLGIKVRDAIINSLIQSQKSQQIITAKTDGRISK